MSEFARRVTEAMEAGVAMSKRDWARQAVGLRARIKELEREHDYWISPHMDYPKGAYITHDQIKAAWKMVDEEPSPSDEIGFVEESLAELGIKRCEHPRVDGELPKDREARIAACDACNGDGFTIE